MKKDNKRKLINIIKANIENGAIDISFLPKFSFASLLTLNKESKYGADRQFIANYKSKDLKISDLKVGEILELSYDQEWNNRFRKYVATKKEYFIILKMEEKYVEMAPVDNIKKAQKLKDRLQKNVDDNEEVMRGCAATINSRFESLGMSPSDFDWLDEYERGDECCELCDTPIKNIYIIRNVKNKKFGLRVGSTCVIKQATASEDRKLSILFKIASHSTSPKTTDIKYINLKKHLGL